MNACEADDSLWTFPGGTPGTEIDPVGFRALLSAAREAKSRAYAPYSCFQVGAAVMMEDGSVFIGANVENASYGATICAERSAIAAAVSAGHRRIARIAVTTSAAEGTPIADRSPCGICRQVISEFADDDTLVLLDAGDTADGRMCGEVITLATLLPWRFRLG